MPDIFIVDCKYCGAVMDVGKAVKINLETGEYKYACENCAIQFAKKDDNGQYIESPSNNQDEELNP